MKFISYFLGGSVVLYDYSKIEAISEINKSLSKKKIARGDTWQHLVAPRVMLTSA